MRVSAEAPANFAVSVLMADGLRIAPFDVHPSGDRVLRKAGLTAEIWLEWVRVLTESHDDVGRVSLRPTSQDEWQKLRTVVEPLVRPATVCPGPEELRLRLDDLWAQETENMERWKRNASVKYSGTFWARVFRSIPPQSLGATFYLVTYPVPVLLFVSSTAWLLSVGYDESADALGGRLKRALERSARSPAATV